MRKSQFTQSQRMAILGKQEAGQSVEEEGITKTSTKPLIYTGSRPLEYVWRWCFGSENG